MFLSQLCAQTSICREVLMGWEVIPAGLLLCWGAPSLPLRALWVPYWGEQALLALPAAVAQLGLDIDPGFDAHKIFPITSLLWSRKHIFFDSKYSIIPATQSKRWQQDVAEGEDEFWEVRSCGLEPGCFKSLSKRIACVELGSNRSWDGLILVRAGKWPFLLREGWVRIAAGVPWEAHGCAL